MFKIDSKTLASYMVVGSVDLILYLCSKISDLFDADFFVVVLMAINGKEQVRNQAGKYLDHQSIAVSSPIHPNQ
jgi:hypothetical protein